MKKLLAIVLAAVMVLSLAACGGGGGGTATGKIPHDQITHVLEGKAETTYHDFVDGKCTRCAETTIFRQEGWLERAASVLLNHPEGRLGA